MSKLDGKTLDIEEQNIEKLKELFPEVFKEAKIDFEKLKQLLGDYVHNSKEKYRFTWNGKDDALRLSQTQSMGTLRPVKEESKNWDNTRNLYIEGDNLEVLKLLQKSYFNKVKMIYIDPPYNTGKDFVYTDKFKDNIKNYKKITGQLDNEGKTTSTNQEYSGRYHTDWLNMMYPRLRLAKNLLTHDGVIFISIDDNEVHNLRKICDEIFGEDNFIDSIVWEKVHTRKNSSINFSSSHEYILVYAKKKRNNSSDDVGFKRNLLPREDNSAYSNPDNDSKGPWKTDPITAHNYYAANYKIIKPNGVVMERPKDRYWAYSEDTWKKLVESNSVIWGKRESMPMRKRYLNEVQDGLVPITLFNRKFAGDSSQGKREIDSVLDHKGVFDYTKPTKLIKRLSQIGSNSDSIILDFFSGSSTTAHGIMDLNAKDNSNRKYIMIQLPELTNERSTAYKVGYENIAEIGKERIRRAGDKIKSELQEKYEKATQKERKNIKIPNELDIGFKTFKLDSSNIKEWNPGKYDDLQVALQDSLNPYVEGRTEEDVVYEMILKMGLDLTYPIRKHEADGRIIYSVGYGLLMICLSDNTNLSVAKKMLEIKNDNGQDEFRVIFRDGGFNSDENKTNIKETLKSAGLAEEGFITL